jgi:hypothetical protein
MAYVEEVIPEEPLQLPLESLLFTVPENWQPPSHFSVKFTAPAIEFFTCIMEEAEEVHTCIMGEEFLHLDSQDISLPGDIKFSNTAVEDEELGKEEEVGKEKTGMAHRRLQARLSVA